MNTEKEKALELIEKFRPQCYCFLGSGMLTNTYDESVSTMNAKQCAIIAVDEMIYENNLHLSSFGRERIGWLIEVKQELEKI